MTDAAEVRVKLILDDAASAASSKVQASLGGVATQATDASAFIMKLAAELHKISGASNATNEVNKLAAASAAAAEAAKKQGTTTPQAFSAITAGAKDAKTAVHDYAQSVARAVITGQLMVDAAKGAVGLMGKAWHGLGDMLGDAIGAAQKRGADVWKISGGLGMMTQLDPAKANDVSQILYRGFEQAAIKTGVASSAMAEAFGEVAARSSGTVEHIQKLTENMAMASKVVPGGLDALREGFVGIEQGMIRPKNAIVQLVASTGLLKGTAKDVAKEMAKMTPAEQIKLGEDAIVKMADRASKMPLSYGGIMQSMAEMKKTVLEAVGAPLMRGIAEMANKRRNMMLENYDSIQAGAERVGNVLAGFVSKGSNFIDQFLSVFTGSTTGIGASFDQILETVDEHVSSFLESGRIWAKTFLDVWNLAKGIWQGIEAGIKGIDDTFQDIADEFRSVKDTVNHPQGDAQMGIAAAKSGMSVKGLASYENSDVSEHAKRADKYAKDLTMPMSKVFTELDKMSAAARSVGATDTDVAKMREGVLKARSAIEEGGGDFLKAAQYSAVSTDGGVDVFLKAYERAYKANDKGMMAFAQRTVIGSESLQAALLESGMNIAGGMAAFTAGLGQQGGKDAKDKFSKKAIADAGGKAAGGAAGVHMSGGQTFHIKQDFRDQDPDRIAVVFREDLVRHATARNQSKLAGVYGT